MNGTILEWSLGTCNSMASGTTNTLMAVSGSSPSDAFAVGLSGTILRYNGTAWAADVSPVQCDLTDVFYAGSGVYFATGVNGTILTNAGSGWSTMQSGVSDPLNGVWCGSPTDAWAVGANGTVVHFDGAAWSSTSGVTANHLYDVFGVSASNVYAVGANGEKLRFDGISWLPYEPGIGVPCHLYGVWCNSSTWVAVGSNGSRLLFDGSGKILEGAGNGNWHLYDVFGNGPSEIYCVGDGDLIMRHP